MVPNPVQVNNLLDNPIRDAAIHFGAYLQLKGLLQGGNELFGNIEVNQLRDQFTNYYQPEFHSYLVVSELLNTLRRYNVIKNRSRRRRNNNNNIVSVQKHPQPSQVKQPHAVPRQRLYVDQSRVLRERVVPSDVVNESHCRLCKISFFNEESKNAHLKSDLHTFRLQYREKRSSFKSEVGGAKIIVNELEENQNEVIIRVGERRNVTVSISLDAPYSEAKIHKIIDLKDEVNANPTEFSNDIPIKVNVSAMFSETGAYIYPLVAKIMPAKLCLLKDLIFRVESELMDQLAPCAPYIQRKTDVLAEMEGAILPGEELIKAQFKLQVKMKLMDHKIPGLYNKLLVHKLDRFENMTQREEEALNKVLELLCGLKTYKEAMRHVSQTKTPFTQPLDRDNYSDRFDLLIDLEEMQEQRQIKNYDRSNETLQQCNTRFLLKIPDLSEGRPSVTKGDKVHVRLQHDDTFTYEGIIHEIREQGLLLGFHPAFIKKYTALKNSGIVPRVDVRFVLNRFPILNMHRALSLIKTHGAHSIVFPGPTTGYYPPTIRPSLREWVNPLIGSNPEQQKAVQKIVSKSSGNSPYLVFGPPGTGKTVTIVETIVQVWHATQTQVSRQLVCAPSNAACDNVASSLINTLPPTAKILRLFSLSTDLLKVPKTLLEHSNYDKKGKTMFMPSLNEIMDHHIIIATIVSSGRLVTGGAGGQFQYVYIDECGQATEPEALIAIAGLITSKLNPSLGQLVLAGDPEQLGPVLSSQLAKDFGLGVSLLERLMKQNELYRKVEGTGYDSNYLTKLVQNFRSHPAILSIPNRLFYDNELEPKGDPAIINKAIGWKKLPNKNFPLIFHGVQGMDERESNSPSYFNRQEIEIVFNYIEELLKKGLPNNYKVKPEDIGVITPYRKQVQKFRKGFELKKWDIRVGSVEEFQGSEKLIIFISTVRSSVALVDEDYRFKLGFLKNPKRFNVSVTRAKALLIVVGNPNILRHDKQWYELLKYCRDNRAAVGLSFPDDDPPDHEQEHIAG